MIVRRLFWLALSSLVFGMATLSQPGCGESAPQETATPTDTTTVVETPPERANSKKAR